MKTQAALVGPDRAVHLDAEPAVDVQLASVILPRHPEHDHAFRFDDPLDYLRFPIFRMLIEDERKRLDYFLHGLVKLRFARILGLHVGHQSGNIVFHDCLRNALPHRAAASYCRMTRAGRREEYAGSSSSTEKAYSERGID